MLPARISLEKYDKGFVGELGGVTERAKAHYVVRGVGVFANDMNQNPVIYRTMGWLGGGRRP